MSKRKRYNADFKAHVALEALKSVQTIADLANRFGLHPTMIDQWNRALLDEASDSLAPVMARSNLIWIDENGRWRAGCLPPLRHQDISGLMIAWLTASA